MPNSSTEDLIFFVRRSELSHEGYARRSGLETSQFSWAMNRQRNLHQKISLAEISDENLLGQGREDSKFPIRDFPSMQTAYHEIFYLLCPMLERSRAAREEAWTKQH